MSSRSLAIRGLIGSLLPFLTGLIFVLIYWYWVRPLNMGPGYLEDFCWDMSRRAMADNLFRFGKPEFSSDLFMAPFGMSIPFFSWSIERDWLGAYFWQWKEFPFIWIYYLAALLLSYLSVGFILSKMGLQRLPAWMLSAFFVTFHVPRHFATWYHVEYLSQHWAIISIFLDAWIWQRFIRHQKWSWNLELWRIFLLVAVLGSPGYFWGPMALEWVVVRGFMLALLPYAWQRKRRSEILPEILIEGRWRDAVLPLVLCMIWISFELRWFIPLVTEMRKLGTIPQPMSWWANPLNVIRPLWLERILEWSGMSLGWPPINKPETVVTIGWVYWLPALLGAYLLRRKKGGPGIKVIGPFVFLTLLAIAYFGFGPFPLVHWPVRTLIPFMTFFRVASRWGHFLPYFAAVMIVLAWPEISGWIRIQWNHKVHRRFSRTVLLSFVLIAAVELTWLLEPLLMQPPLLESSQTLLKNIQKMPGTTVLDMPFCVAGGNGVCTSEQCPNYPNSTISGCLSSWHEKKVYGLYQSRLTDVQCQIYNRSPYLSWFSAWKDQRCLAEGEWDELCRYLDTHTETSAVLVYPDIWKAAGTPACVAQFEKHLGAPVQQGYYFAEATRKGPRGGEGEQSARIWHYAPKCRKAATE